MSLSWLIAGDTLSRWCLILLNNHQKLGLKKSFTFAWEDKGGFVPSKQPPCSAPQAVLQTGMPEAAE